VVRSLGLCRRGEGGVETGAGGGGGVMCVSGHSSARELCFYIIDAEELGARKQLLHVVSQMN
jgi:hypothetical protein